MVNSVRIEFAMVLLLMNIDEDCGKLTGDFKWR
jgi:hypothetical protein